jgi:hypothetical protein
MGWKPMPRFAMYNYRDADNEMILLEGMLRLGNYISPNIIFYRLLILSFSAN